MVVELLLREVVLVYPDDRCHVLLVPVGEGVDAGDRSVYRSREDGVPSVEEKLGYPRWAGGGFVVVGRVAERGAWEGVVVSTGSVVFACERVSLVGEESVEPFGAA